MQSTGESSLKVSNSIIVKKINEVYLRCECESGIGMELNEYFTFFVPGYKFMPAFRNKIWDGKIRLFNRQNHSLYIGLLGYLQTFCNERDYELEIDDELSATENLSLDEAKDFSVQ